MNTKKTQRKQTEIVNTQCVVSFVHHRALCVTYFTEYNDSFLKGKV